MSFTIQTMLGNTALVSGTDLAGNTGKQLVSTTQWEDLQARKDFSSATEDYDKAVEKFFAPLVEAGEKVKEAVTRKQDAAEYVVISEGVESVSGQPAQIVQLSKDSMILRFIEEGNTDRLVWIDESTLGILAS